MSALRVGMAQVAQTSIIQQNAEKVLEVMGKAHREGVELLCFPEAHLAGYRIGLLDPDSPCDEAGLSAAVGQIRDQCRELSMGVILGTETPNPPRKPYNSALVLDQNGAIIGLHHKSTLTYLDAKGYSEGSGPTNFTFQGVPMGTVICYEGFRFPQHTRALAEAGAKVVFQPTCSTTLPNMEWKQPVLESLIVARAAEITIYYIAVNLSHRYSNHRSLVVQPNGLIQAEAPTGQEILVVADIDPDKATHAFLNREDMEEVFRASGEYAGIHGPAEETGDFDNA